MLDRGRRPIGAWEAACRERGGMHPPCMHRGGRGRRGTSGMALHEFQQVVQSCAGKPGWREGPHRPWASACSVSSGQRLEWGALRHEGEDEDSPSRLGRRCFRYCNSEPTMHAWACSQLHRVSAGRRAGARAETQVSKCGLPPRASGLSGMGEGGGWARRPALPHGMASIGTSICLASRLRHITLRGGLSRGCGCRPSAT